MAIDYRERWELKDYLVGQRLARRLALFHLGVAALLAGFLLQFWYLQGVHGAEYAVLAESNRLRRIPVAPARGIISDREGRVIAATRPSLSLVLLREGAPDVNEQLERLATYLETPAPDLRQRLEAMRARPSFEPLLLKEDAHLDDLARIESRRELFRSVEVQQTARRSYPHGDLFAHVLGYVGEVSEAQLAQASAAGLSLGDIVGKSGVERAYDGALRGVRGWNVVSVNNVGRRMGEVRTAEEPQHGAPLSLTLHTAMQQALREGLAAERGAGVFLDPWTGEVLALVSTPTFDPNAFAGSMTAGEWRGINEDPQKPLLNRAIASFYAPGSTFKVVMALAGLESGQLRPESTVHCVGSTTIYGHRRLCWKKGGHGTVDLRRALAHSCNVYFYHLGQRLGIEPIARMARSLNIGRLTGIDLPNESKGVLPSPEWKQQSLGEPWYAGDTISVAIGQGYIAVTPMQMATMIGAVATAGVVARPHLDRAHRVEPQRIELGAESVRVVHLALRDAVEGGTGRRADLEGITVAGKTGTAQVFKRSAGIDADELPKEERDHAWFVGWAPHDHPRVAFAVVVEHGGHGGTTAAPIARRVLEAYFEQPAPPTRPDDAERARRGVGPEDGDGRAAVTG